MQVLTAEQVSAAVLEAALTPIDEDAAVSLANYGNLLLKWGARTNLTSISDADGVLHRHLVESVAAAQALPAGTVTVLDYGSGAGLPGIPIAICRPDLRVTLAESQSKKVAFLREALRTLGLNSSVFAGRVAEMPETFRFDAVTMRAVDKMAAAASDAVLRVREGGWLILFATASSDEALISTLAGQPFRRSPLPTIGHLILIQPENVPRGTHVNYFGLN